MTSSQLPKPAFSYIFLWVFLPFTGAYFLTTFFNQVNAMLAPYLFHDISMTAAQLGLTTSIYLLIFALAQLPLGVFLDHYGPRKIQSILFIVAAIGIVIFASAVNPILLFIGRGLIGVGMSSGLMSGFRAMRSCLPKEKIPLANSLLMAAGTLGAVFSTLPVELMLQIISWRMLLIFIATLTLLVSAWIFLFVPDALTMSAKSHLTLKKQALETKHIFLSPYFWRIAPLVAFAFGSNMSIVGLWAGPWLSDVALLSHADIAKHLLIISISLITGIIFWGTIADKLTIKFKQPLTRLIAVGALLYIIIQLLLVAGISTGSYLLWFFFGFMSRYTTLAYAAISQHFHHYYAGRATAVLNMFFFLVAFFTQLGMGLLISMSQKDVFGRYPAHAYYVAFSVIIFLQLLGYFWFLFYRKAENPMRHVH